MSTIVSFRPTDLNKLVLESVPNKTEFLNELIEKHRIEKLRQDLIRGFSDPDNYDEEWVNFDNEDYFKLINS